MQQPVINYGQWLSYYALVKDFVGGEPSVGFAAREFSWRSLRNSFSLAETEDQSTPFKPLSRYQQSRSQERSY